jgi:NADH-quinone oxidoreductase subunit N
MAIDYLTIAPPLIVAATALLVLIARHRRLVEWGTVVGLVLALAALAGAGQPRATFCSSTTSCSYVVDRFTLLFQLIVLIAGITITLLARAETRLPSGEFHFLLLSALTGALTLVAARDLVTVVVALEVLSLPVFPLVALRKDDKGAEAGLKMFLVSVVSTAITLFGISLIYGVTGSLRLAAIARALPTSGPLAPIAAVAVLLVLVGLGFKIAVVPFHFWAPDTYQGAPITVAALLSVISKAAGFAGLIIVLTNGFLPLARVWGPVLAVLAALTMTVGNLLALRQRVAVRLLAWSSIAQAGYALAPLGAIGAVTASTPELVGASIGYVAIYAAMNIGAFAVTTAIDRPDATIDEFRGLARTNPAAAIAMAFFLACLAGLPPGFAGLFAKIIVIKATVGGGYGWLAVVVAVNTVLGLAYYLRWGELLFRDRTTPRRWKPSAHTAIAVGVAAAATIALSILPQLVIGGSSSLLPFG